MIRSKFPPVPTIFSCLWGKVVDGISRQYQRYESSKCSKKQILSGLVTDTVSFYFISIRWSVQNFHLYRHFFHVSEGKLWMAYRGNINGTSYRNVVKSKYFRLHSLITSVFISSRSDDPFKIFTCIDNFFMLMREIGEWHIEAISTVRVIEML